MQLNTKEHYDLMLQFEREFCPWRIEEKEDKRWWAKGHIYQNGELNELFLAYRKGYALAKSIYQQ